MLDFMMPHSETGMLVFDSKSDVRKATVNMNTTMDREIISVLYSNCISSANILGATCANNSLVSGCY